MNSVRLYGKEVNLSQIGPSWQIHYTAHTMHCQWGTIKKTPKITPFPLGFRHPAGEGPSHGHRQHAQKMINIARVVQETCSQTDTQTHTHRRAYNNTSPPLPRAK